MITVQDDFNRADNAATLGSPQVGPDPTVLWGPWGIIANEAYAPGSGPPTFADAVVVWETGQESFDVQVTVTYPYTTAGLVFRVVDAYNFWFFGIVTTPNLVLMRRVAGVFVTFWSSPTAPFGSVLPPLRHTLRVVQAETTEGTRSATMSLYHNGELKHSLAEPTHLAASAFGLRVSWPLNRLDDLIASDVAELEPTSWTGASLELEPLGASAPSTYPARVYKGRDTAEADLVGL